MFLAYSYSWKNKKERDRDRERERERELIYLHKSTLLNRQRRGSFQQNLGNLLLDIFGVQGNIHLPAIFGIHGTRELLGPHIFGHLWSFWSSSSPFFLGVTPTFWPSLESMTSMTQFASKIEPGMIQSETLWHVHLKVWRLSCTN